MLIHLVFFIFLGKQESFTYSQQFIEFIVSEIKKNPIKFVDSLRNKKR
ncbi:hypothetical protein [Staphylococcus caprae]|nr:hypothetical protein [Staphylococcus caprae]